MPRRTILEQELEISTLHTKLIIAYVMLTCACVFIGYLLFKIDWIL